MFGFPQQRILFYSQVFGTYNDPMKKLLATLLLLSPLSGQSDYSEPHAAVDESRLAKVTDFIPENWKAIALAAGDMNDDNKEDYALIIQKTDPQNTATNGGLVATETDTNPRHLLLLFTVQEDGQEKLIRKRIYRKFIPSLAADSPDMAEPVSYIGIDDNTLEIKFEDWTTEGSWQRNDITYKFRYDKGSGHFRLTFFEHHNVNKASGMFKKSSIDLLSGKQEKAFGSMSSPRHRRESNTIKTDNWTICDIKKPLTFRP